MKNACCLVTPIIFLFVCSCLTAQDDYTIEWQNLNSAGGGKISGGPYVIRGVMGQPTGGKSDSADYGLVGGYFGAPLFFPACMPYPTAEVSGSTQICEGDTTSILVDLTGTPPWQIQWSDGLVDADVMVSPLIRTVSPITTTVYALQYIADDTCEGIASGAASVEIVPFGISVDPARPIVVQGIDTRSFSCWSTCDVSATELQWSIPATGFLYPLNQDTIVLDPPPPGITVFQVDVTHLVTSETLSETRTLLAAIDPIYFDLNQDGCNNEQDLFELAQTWRSLYPNSDDPNGDGILDIRDFMFINLDDLGTLPPCTKAGH